jgi:hypothetical protein
MLCNGALECARETAMTGPGNSDWTLSDLSLDGAALEPLPASKPSATGVAEGRANFQVDSRDGKERRVVPDRRKELRFGSDRRSGKDRRPRRSWEPGSNL